LRLAIIVAAIGGKSTMVAFRCPINAQTVQVKTLAGTRRQMSGNPTVNLVFRHLRVLRQARRVRAKRIGREQRYQLDATELARMQRDWFAQFTSIWDTWLVALKERVELEEARGARETRTRGRDARE
jgi:hypothetical protein